jgi:hypothetical protein
MSSPPAILRGMEHMNSAYRPSKKLTFEDAIDVWIRHWKGEFQHRIAASLDCNPGRINEILKEVTHPGSKQAALAKRVA